MFDGFGAYVFSIQACRTCGGETLSMKATWKAPIRLCCTGTVDSLMQFWNSPSVSSQRKLYICLAHPLCSVCRQSCCYKQGADLAPSVLPFVVPKTSLWRTHGGVHQMRCSARRLGIVQPHGTGVITTSTSGEPGAATGNQATTVASFITWVLCRLQVQPPGNSFPGPTQHQSKQSHPLHPLFWPQNMSGWKEAEQLNRN